MAWPELVKATKEDYQPIPMLWGPDVVREHEVEEGEGEGEKPPTEGQLYPRGV